MTDEEDIMVDTLPVLADGRLPDFYVNAKQALTKCSRIDQCKDWGNKAEALASYAKQADDDSMRKMADRIQARAIQRCGQLLKEFKKDSKDNLKKGPRGGGAPTSGKTQREAAEDAGLSKDQEVTAVRVANVPDQEFEKAVESDDPPTVTELAERGKKSKKTLVDLGGRDPADFQLSTTAQGHLARFAKFAAETDPAKVVRGTLHAERLPMTTNAAVSTEWLTQILQLTDG